MNVKFSKDELAMVYQYAADTKQETLAGLREIVPVIRDRQAREIVESKSENWTLSRSRSAAALSPTPDSGLSRSGIIQSGAGWRKQRRRQINSRKNPKRSKMRLWRFKLCVSLKMWIL